MMKNAQKLQKFTISVAQMFRDADGGNLDDINHICLLAKDVACREFLYDPGLAKNGTIVLRLCEMLQQADNTMLHLQVCFWFKQSGQLWRQCDRWVDDSGGMRLCHKIRVGGKHRTW